MTIASAFNDIAVAQGGTAAKSGAITAAIDALNDALAGSDQPQAKTIEQAVRLLGEHIGGGGGGGTVKCYMIDPENPATPIDISNVIVEDINGESVVVSEDSFEDAGETVNCISFTATVGEVYAISQRGITGGELKAISNQEITLPSMFDDGNAALSFIAYKEPMIAMIGEVF